MKKENVVEVLYTDQCPFWREALRLVEEVANGLKADVTIRKVKVSNDKEAKKLKFPGSPTVRINGVDIDPAMKETEGYIGCRIYMHEGRSFEYPPKQMIKSALQRMIKSRD